MTADELRSKFNNEFGLGDWPEKYEVDAETYANVCQWIFRHKAIELLPTSRITVVDISLGPNHGILFKNVELIYKISTKDYYDEEMIL